MSHDRNVVRFVPSHFEGLSDVEEVIVRPDQLEVKSAGRWLMFPFASIARPQEHAATSFFKRIMGMRVCPPMVGERDWCQTPNERFFVWYTDPPLKTCMPKTEGGDYGTSHFPRVHEVLAEGGFATFDLA